MLGRWRAELASRLIRQLHRLVAHRVRRDASEVEHHRERRKRLTDGLAGKPVRGEVASELGYIGRRDPADATLTEARENSPKVDAVGGGGAVGDVDT